MRREIQPWEREWIIESIRDGRPRDSWAFPVVARFALGFCLGMVILMPCAQLLLRMI